MLHVSSVPDGCIPKRLDKVPTLLDGLISNFKANMKPSSNLSVDETMIGFRGRFGAKQYIPNKPTKYVVKAFTLADSLNGYILDVLLYTGADTLDNSNPRYPELPKPAQTVVALTKDYLNEGRTIFTDRYYTSIPLLQELESQLTFFTDICMKNRQRIPKNFRQKSFRLSDGEVQAYRSGRFMALAWRSPSKKKGIIMLSSKDSAQMTSVTSSATHRISEKPVVVDNYNQSMRMLSTSLTSTLFITRSSGSLRNGGRRFAFGFWKWQW